VQPSVCQLFRLNEFLVLAVFSKSPYPVKVIYDRPPRKMALSPHLNHRTFQRISSPYVFTHERLNMYRSLKLLRKSGRL
jgi:hypothetical protein